MEGSSISHLMRKASKHILQNNIPASEDFHCMLQRIKGTRHMIHPHEQINTCLNTVDCPFVFAPARNAFCKGCKIFGKDRPYVAYDRTLRKGADEKYGIGKGFTGEACGQLEPYRMGNKSKRGCVPVYDPKSCIPGIPSYVNYAGQAPGKDVVQPYMHAVPWDCKKPEKKGGACISYSACGGAPMISPACMPYCAPGCPPGCAPGYSYPCPSGRGRRRR